MVPQWDRSKSKWPIQMIFKKGPTKDYYQYSIMLDHNDTNNMKMHYYESTQQRLSFNIITQVNDSTLSKSKTITIIILSIPLSIFFFFLNPMNFQKRHSNGFLITFLASLRNRLNIFYQACCSVVQVNEVISLESKIVTIILLSILLSNYFGKFFDKFISKFLAYHNIIQIILLVPLLYHSLIAHLLLLLQFS